ncbi:MAG: hypothetical protein Alpg2KO_31180 [Alphaproteobacteria bacterium]
MTIYTNQPGRAGDYVVNFFRTLNEPLDEAFLAAPFFTSCEAIHVLQKVPRRCSKIYLLVRLCEATCPEALSSALEDEDVLVRFYNSQLFHAKLYICGSKALVGSANLTDAGLKRNREIAVVIDKHSASSDFDECLGLFAELWDSASVLTEQDVSAFRQWRESISRSAEQVEGIEPVAPPNAKAAEPLSADRVFGEDFKREYVESLLPAYKRVRTVYRNLLPNRHPDWQDVDEDFELDRFLYHLCDGVSEAKAIKRPILHGQRLQSEIEGAVREWSTTQDTKQYEMELQRAHNLQNLATLLRDKEAMGQIPIEDLVDSLGGCAAFYEMLRFTEGGYAAHKREFVQQNGEKQIRKSLEHLLCGAENYSNRICDLIFNPDYKLKKFGIACTLELFGWVNSEDVPPMNNRARRGLRYLGFEVKPS